MISDNYFIFHQNVVNIHVKQSAKICAYMYRFGQHNHSWQKVRQVQLWTVLHDLRFFRKSLYYLPSCFVQIDEKIAFLRWWCFHSECGISQQVRVRIWAVSSCSQLPVYPVLHRAETTDPWGTQNAKVCSCFTGSRQWLLVTDGDYKWWIDYSGNRQESHIAQLLTYSIHPFNIFACKRPLRCPVLYTDHIKLLNSLMEIIWIIQYDPHNH